MNLLWRILILFFLINTLYAAGKPLKVGVEHFDPPFSIQGAHNELYGFDIDMMNSICKMLQRSCEFRMMKFGDLIPAITNKEVDVSISGLTITPDRLKVVNFSLPYALSYSHFLTKSSNTQLKQPFSLEFFKGKKIGVQLGSIFAEQIKLMGVTEAQIITYAHNTDLFENLRGGTVDFIMVDTPTALYWAANSAGAFAPIGPSFTYGLGYGIAVTPDDPQLLKDINQALLQFENLQEYQLNYNKYFGAF